MRDRPQPGSLAEWSDDDMDSPPKPTKNAADLVQFARKGVRHALAKQGRRSEENEDPMSDSEAEEGQGAKRLRHGGQAVNYKEPAVSDSEEHNNAAEEGEDVEAPSASVSAEDSSSSSDGEEAGEEESPIHRRQPQRQTRNTRGGSGKGSPGGMAARPRRAAAQGPKRYKEALPEVEDDSSADESDVEEPQQGSAKRPRSRAQAAHSRPKQQLGSRGKGQKGGNKKRQSPAEPARRSSRHGERNISYAEDDIEDLIGDGDEGSEQQSGDASGSEPESMDSPSGNSNGSFDSQVENRGPQARENRGAAAAKGKKGKGFKAVKGKAARKKQAVVQSDSDEGETGSEQDGSASGASGSEASDSQEAVDFSRQKVEKLLWRRVLPDGTEEFHCKFHGMSYRTTAWLSLEELEAADKMGLVRGFRKREGEGGVDPYGDLEEGQGVHPAWLKVDRVIAKRSTRGGQVQYLVKWASLGHSQATWEDARGLKDDEAHIQRFERFSKEPEEDDDDYDGPKEIPLDAVPRFSSGRQLRDYQRASLQWMASNCSSRVNCVLGDEMGLGKTAQSISVLAFQEQFMKVRGPFLIIAPLTTLGHWQREVETWTDMNCMVYAGSKQDREIAEKYDLFYPSKGKRRGDVKPNIVLASYETVLKEASLFKSITWETVIIDEAHRMKSTGARTRQVLVDMHIEWLLLLTGTPVQNNMRELYGLLNLLNPEQFSSEEDFIDQFGDEKSMTFEQRTALQEVLRPILLRRLKEDVETLPEKEEVIIWVELTAEQRAYYKAIYEKEIGTLMAGASNKNLPNLKNLAMELRKVCNHPYLCNGLEEDIAARQAAKGGALSELDLLIQASGKMVLLAKLLPKLREEGHKVLIFSQFKIMLDVLEDYMRLSNYPCERIDGSTASRDRQAAIDRYSKEGSEGFVFLLSTRAGGQGITLTAADTVILYDSDWNPQNDLQAMARAHRIGQDKEVTIYRLVSKNTYEEELFACSSRKQGLDEAILGNLGGESGDPELDSKRIANLLKHGAHCLQDMEVAAQTEGFATEGIDDILENRTEKRQLGSRKGNSFSVAHFGVGAGKQGDAQEGDGKAKSGDEKSYWSALMPDAAQAHAAAVAAAKAGPIILAPRRRRKVDYAEEAGGRSRQIRCDSDSDYRSGGEAAAEDDDVLVSHKGKRRRSEAGKEEGRRWSAAELKSLEERLIALGAGRTAELQQQAGLGQRSLEECQEVEAALVALVERAVTLVPKEEKQQRPRKGTDDAAAAAGPDAAAEGSAGKENAGGASAAPNNIEKSRVSTADVPLFTEDTKLPRLADKAMRSKDFVSRLLKQAHRYHLALQERAALAALLATDTPDQPFQLPPLTYKGGHPPEWWRGEVHNRALLRACHDLGWTSNRKSAEAILADPRYGFDKEVQKLPPAAAASDAAAPTGASADSAAPGGAAAAVRPLPAAEAGLSGQQQPAAPGSAPPAPTGPQRAASANGALLLDEKEWIVMVNKVNVHMKKLLAAVLHPDVAAAQQDAQRRRLGPKPGSKRVPSALPAHLAGGEGSMQRSLSRHDSNSLLPAAPGSDKRPANAQPRGEPAAKRPQPPQQAQHPSSLDAAAVAQALAAALAGGDAGPPGSGQASGVSQDPIESATAGGGGTQGAGAGGGSKPSGVVHKPAAGTAEAQQAAAPNPLFTLGLQPGQRAEEGAGMGHGQGTAGAGGQPLGPANQAGGERKLTKGKVKALKQATLFDMRPKAKPAAPPAATRPAAAAAAATGSNEDNDDVIVLE